jgi:hypothetical protein
VADDPSGHKLEISVTPHVILSGSNERGVARVRLSELVVGTVRDNARSTAGRSIWWGSDILVNSSQRVEISRNTVVSSTNAIGLVDTDRGVGRLGPYRVAEVDVHDNVVRMAPGAETGLVGRDTAFQPQAQVRFRRNTYHVPDPGAESWQWEGPLDAAGWRDRGQDRDGTFQGS